MLCPAFKVQEWNSRKLITLCCILINLLLVVHYCLLKDQTWMSKPKFLRWRASEVVIDKATGEIRVSLDGVEEFLNRSGLDYSKPESNSQLVLDMLCRLRHQDKGAKRCCLSRDRDLVECFRLLGTLGAMPESRQLKTNTTEIPLEPPEYAHPKIYMSHNEEHKEDIQCTVNLETRRRMYHLLAFWIKLARENHIIWWIESGSLLGAVREGDFIPYDYDFDISVLGIKERTLRRLASASAPFSYGKVNLVLNHCKNGIPRSCRGLPQNLPVDPCGICRPAGRLISGLMTFLDIFPIYLEIRQEGENATLGVGLLDPDKDGNEGSLTYSLDTIFPLDKCKLMGLEVPCPQNSSTVLMRQYGKDYTKPAKMCNQRSGYWYQT
ncbi:unnamed protein product [Calicophoron daubneyi]|uniref:LicD/FKTN/FKRP nucleotidyltransferase domain-containing protein n=1 Tax=Calicophoron daubneyi TaxID=300641 RepID=A0AAV2TTW6_CALDB